MSEGSTVRAAGGVLWRPAADGGVEVAVVHRPKYDDWSLPKGKLEPDEPEVVAACREVREETGFDAVVGRGLGTTRYTVVQDGAPRSKTVRWWALRADGGSFSPGPEVDRLRWLPPADAEQLLGGRGEEQPLRRFAGGPCDTRTLLLVRHASAGSRAAWPADDDARPLDERGRAQAEALCRVLPLYRPQRLVAAPLERCTATLQPLADRLRLPVEPDVNMSARGWAEDPERTLQRLGQLVAEAPVTVVSSQGEVLPSAVARLAAASGVEVGQLRAAKGSVWALSFDATGRLVDADYTERLLPA